MTLKSYIRLLIAALCLVLAPCAANAAYVPLTCDGSGGVSGGELYDADSACQIDGIEHIFSTVVCNFVKILNGIMDNVYCSMQYAIKGTLAVLLTLYIAIFGVQILMGTTQLTAGEMVTRLLKIAGVWTFCTQSTWAIGLMLQFFLAIAGNGVQWVTGPIVGGNSNAATIYLYLDDFLYSFTAGLLLQANAKLVGFFMMMATIQPGIAFMGVYWLWSTLLMLGKTLLSFVSCLAAIAFLISLSPFFLSFLLFRTTYHFFEAWMKYMLSYSLRIVIVFAVVAMWASIMSIFIGFFNELSNAVFPYTPVVQEGGPTYKPELSWGLCRLNYDSDQLGPTIACKPSYCGGTYDPENCAADKNAMIGPGSILEESMFLYYIIYHLVTMILISYAFKKLMDYSDTLADAIVGPAYIPVFGPGWGSVEGADHSSSMHVVDHGGHNSMLDKASRGISNFVNNASKQVSQRPPIKP